MDKIYALILEHAGLPAGTALEPETDLYKAGMRSFSSVQLMLALEDGYEIEFPEAMLVRETFGSPGAIHRAVQALTQADA